MKTVCAVVFIFCDEEVLLYLTVIMPNGYYSGLKIRKYDS